jgi:PLD-like domain
MYPHIQDPEDETAPFLHEIILDACRGARRGAGAFAFVTKDGAELLLRDKVFQEFASSGKFDLVVGVDEVTNVRALNALQQIQKEIRNLRVKVFYHENRSGIFHPKFCWFRHKSKAFLITGSANLTKKGMRANWEAFRLSELPVRAAIEMEREWERWTELHAPRLKEVDDELVLARAALNVIVRKPGQPRRAEEEEAAGEVGKGETAGPARMALIAEIPRAAGRWNQANFDLKTFRDFFGARPGKSVRVVFQHVDSEGQLGPVESRPSVAVKSRNFRFELDAAAGRDYPDEGRPIAVFIRISPRTFIYRLLMPDDPHYNTVLTLLDTLAVAPAGRMRRVPTTTDKLREAWPDSPLWVTPLELQD